MGMLYMMTCFGGAQKVTETFETMIQSHKYFVNLNKNLPVWIRG